jgi:hypothetical protein
MSSEYTPMAVELYVSLGDAGTMEYRLLSRDQSSDLLTYGTEGRQPVIVDNRSKYFDGGTGTHNLVIEQLPCDRVHRKTVLINHNWISDPSSEVIPDRPTT